LRGGEGGGTGGRLGQQLRELVLQQPLRLAATNDSKPASAPTPILVFERSAFLLIQHGAPAAVAGGRGGRGGGGARLTASAASSAPMAPMALSPPAPPSLSGEVVARRRGRFPFPASAEEEVKLVKVQRSKFNGRAEEESPCNGRETLPENARMQSRRVPRPAPPTYPPTRPPTVAPPHPVPPPPNPPDSASIRAVERSGSARLAPPAAREVRTGQI